MALIAKKIHIGHQLMLNYRNKPYPSFGMFVVMVGAILSPNPVYPKKPSPTTYTCLGKFSQSQRRNTIIYLP